MRIILWILGYFIGSFGTVLICENYFGVEKAALHGVVFAVLYLAICHIFNLHGMSDEEPSHWYDDVHVMD